MSALLLTYIILFLAAMALRRVLEKINIRNIEVHGHEVPDVFKGEVEKKTLVRMKDYTIATSSLSSLEHLLTDVLILLILLGGVLPWLTSFVQAASMPFIATGLVFFFILSLISGIFEIPFDLYSTFGIEKRFGFSTTTFRLWLTDQLKSFVISTILMLVVFGAFLGLIQLAPGSWWIWVWLFYAAFQLLVLWLYPVVIAPLFNKFEALDIPEINDGITSLMEGAGLKVSGIFMMDAGRRSKHSNAYFTGIGKSKRIVLYDTLVENNTPEEIIAVFAHELGHWKKGHVKKQLILASVISLALMYLAYVLVESPMIYNTFGMEEPVIYTGLVILVLLFKPVSFFMTPLGAMLSRRFERQADEYSFQVTKDVVPLVSALKKLAKDNLSNLHPHPLYSWFYYSHPPLGERIERLEGMEDQGI